MRMCLTQVTVNPVRRQLKILHYLWSVKIQSVGALYSLWLELTHLKYFVACVSASELGI